MFDGVNDYMLNYSNHTITNLTMIAVIDIATIDFLDSTNTGGAAVTVQQYNTDNFDAIVYHEHSTADRKIYARVKWSC